LDSFLIEITADILRFKENGKYVLDTIRDAAGQVISLAFYEEFSFWFFFRKVLENGQVLLHLNMVYQ
jgi:hypothetical protein